MNKLFFEVSPLFFRCLWCTLFLLSITDIHAQSSDQENNEKIPFLQPADTLHRGRFWTCSAIGATIYGSAVIGLNQIWYAETERSSFQFFNDWGEWRHVDKAGHAFTAYNYANWMFTGARWTGMKRRNAMWTAAGLSFFLQGTVEMMDAYSAKWGFSMPDIAFNTLGAGLFVAQELAWQEQRIVMKVSSTVPTYPTDIITSVDGANTITYRERAHSLYGKRFPETLLKDYNAQTNWLSFNVRSFMKTKNSRIPKWLNVAVGYGAQNMYEGYNYDWVDEDTGIAFERDPDLYPRYSQWYLSLDVDLTRIKTKSRFLKTAFSILNFIKIPAPSLEVNTLGNVRFLPIYF
ncbi:MAG: DUF2279 domain-containing protein [Bacteroidota bacterium]